MPDHDHTLPADSPLTRRLLEVLELKGYGLERLPKLDAKRPGIAVHASAFRSFDDAYLVDLHELPDDEEIGREEWKAFRKRLERSGLERGVLVTNRGFNPEVVSEAERAGDVALFTFDELLADLIDFTPYLKNVVSEWESDPLHSGEVIIPAEAAASRDGTRFALDPYLDTWLETSGRHPLFLLGRYGSGKTTFVKRLCARLARGYLRDPIGNRVPVFVPLREYANLTEMDELIVARIAELAPEQAPPSRRAFRLLLEAGRFLLVLDGLDELIRRLEPNYVLKNFDKICSLILPGGKAMVTAREGYLGTPEDEAQILGLRPPVTGDAQRRLPRFERLYLEPIEPERVGWYIERRFPDRAEHYRMVLETRPEFLELARTPLLLELMLRSLPLLEGKLFVNPAVVMTAFVHSWAELGKVRRPILSTAEDAIFFVTELAWQMHWSGTYKVHFSELSGRIKMRFRDKTLGSDAPDPFRVDLRECPFVALDRDGNYAFVQNAFLDFLAALAYMRYLLEHGTAPVDNRRTNPDMQRFVRDLATMDERYLQAYYQLLEELKGRDDPTQWLFYRDLLPIKEKARIYAAEQDRVRDLQARALLAAPPGMVYVPGGDFIFGSFEHRDESPVRRVTLASFFADTYPVTNADYLRFLDETGHRRPLWTEEGPHAWIEGKPPEGMELLPATMIGFEDAVAYAAWAGKRLPTEQEWELLARGYEGRRYPWGDEFRAIAANGALSGAGCLTPVGRHPEGVSVFGAHDVSGLVWEWTNSRYDKFHGLKILRGGSYKSDEDELRAANRMFWDPEFPKPDIGFRCVMGASERSEEPRPKSGRPGPKAAAPGPKGPETEE